MQTQGSRQKKIAVGGNASKNADMRRIEIQKREPRDKQITFRLSSRLYDRVEELVEETHQDRSEVLIQLLNWALEAWEEQNSAQTPERPKK